LVGSVYRATCVDGKLAGVLAGDPPRITGDGVATIAQLIEHKNATKPARVGIVRVSEKHLEFLRAQGYILETILPTGLTIDISEKIGLSYGGCSREVTDVTHPKLVAELERAAVATHDPLVGFDFITPSVEVDPDTVRWGIIECNSVPFVNLHHDPLEGTPVNVAGVVWDWVERGIGVK
jgi:cyanophycin synthetase